MPGDPEVNFDIIFAALADRTRRAIVTRLLSGDATVGMLAEPFDISLAAVSKHLSILTSAGIITQHREGRVKRCRLNVDALAGAVTWMETFGTAGTVDLDAMEGRLQEMGLLDDAFPDNPD